jgi:hypothetical protein
MASIQLGFKRYQVSPKNPWKIRGFRLLALGQTVSGKCTTRDRQAILFWDPQNHPIFELKDII